ncbi:alpha/beta fold hydrolase [Kribbella sp. DT2]|uniref:alpha/beta fold hydrolase n=1 Tax=Kribbella sp. DT2 TaxID=3393427 RepID=UPI003CF54E1A
MSARTDQQSRQKRRQQIARTPGVRTIRRPLPDGRTFSLAYTRTTPATPADARATPGAPADARAAPAHSGEPRGDSGGGWSASGSADSGDRLAVLVIPGGPGLASVLPYRGLRAKAARLGTDLLMVEHRGVGLSRTDDDGADLPREAMTVDDVVDDLAAVLEAEGIDQVVVYGCSYGSYLAQGLGVRHPERVAGMVLDSAMVDVGWSAASRGELRSLFWQGTAETRTQADVVRELVGGGVIDGDEAGFPLQVLYEFGGLPMVDRMLDLLAAGRGQRAWRWVGRLGASEVTGSRPFMMEFELVGEIAFRELGTAVAPDGQPLDVSGPFAEAAPRFSAFEREPFDLAAELPAFDWPLVVLSGDRDVRTPRSVAERIVSLAPNATLVPVRDHGHSTLDTAQDLALAVMQHLSRGGDPTGLPADPAGLPGMLNKLIGARLTLAKAMPRGLS